MRFSLKWILIAVVYVAVAAAALSQTTWVYADLLWAASLLAVVYAGLIAGFARGRRQAAAAGFVAASACFCICLYFANDSVPTRRLLVAANVGQAPQGVVEFPLAPPVLRTKPVFETRNTPTGSQQTVRMVQEVVASPATTAATKPASPMTVGQWMAQARSVAPPSPYVDYAIYIRAGNAVGMMFVGGLGCLVGLAAYRAARRDDGELNANK
jgi:hypothetical protein